MKKIVATIIVSAFLYPLTAQYVGQALRFSQTFPSQTARSLSMGGAFVSLGGDLSDAYLNPAGLGVYRKSELTLTPGFGYVKSTADYLNEKGEDYRYHFIFGNAGYVSAYNSKKDNGLVGVAFSLAYNRLNDFNNNIFIEGHNMNNSLADFFMDNAEGNHPDNLNAFRERLAFDTYVIDTTPGLSYYGYETPVFLPVDQRKTIETSGGSGEWSIGFGMNFSHVFYFGMGLGINQLRYKESLVHSEYDYQSLNDFNNFRFTETLDLRGVGYTLKLGFIARPVSFLRVGGALHIPTYYNIEEEYYANMTSLFDNGDSYSASPTYTDGSLIEIGAFEYKLVTPLKAMGGVSFQIGKTGLVAADIEYVDYSNIRYRNKDSYDDMSDFNRDIQEAYKAVLNIKAGGEMRFGPLSVRAGGGYYPSPYATGELNENADYIEISGGVGYRDRNFFIDMGLSTILHDEKYSLYYNNITDLQLNRYRFLTTFGFRF
ncbi:MAG: hypothetical protein JXK95_06665 [Bacteroidales bacterium]|nr:hypothetical protein [Bacteroidales bacterium]